jgi:hypothetical protein
VIGKIYKILGERYVIFNGLAYTCEMAVRQSVDELKSIGSNYKQFNLSKNQTFVIR